jgi:hypothetical protein
MTDIHQPLRDALKAGPTGGKWQVWTSNSFRRIKTDAGASVVEPITQRHDGHPDLHATPETLAYIAAANPATISAILADLEAAEKALKFYADPWRYHGPNQRLDKPDEFSPDGAVYLVDVTRDYGSIAKAALAQMEKGE